MTWLGCPCSSTIHFLPSISSLNLKGNKLTTLPTLSFYGNSLTNLDVSGNLINGQVWKVEMSLPMAISAEEGAIVTQEGGVTGTLVGPLTGPSPITSFEIRLTDVAMTASESADFVVAVTSGEIGGSGSGNTQTITSGDIAGVTVGTLSSSTFVQNTNLNKIDLSNNQISGTILSGTFGSNTKLTTLHLGQNEITTVQSNAFPLSGNNIEILDVSGNKLVSIDNGGFDFSNNNKWTSLRSLNISHNIISSVGTNAFSGLTNIEKIFIEMNQITTIKVTAFSGCIKLSKINLSGNKLKTLAIGTFDHLPALEEITLVGNVIEADVLAKGALGDDLKLVDGKVVKVVVAAVPGEDVEVVEKKSGENVPSGSILNSNSPSTTEKKISPSSDGVSTLAGIQEIVVLILIISGSVVGFCLCIGIFMCWKMKKKKNKKKIDNNPTKVIPLTEVHASKSTTVPPPLTTTPTTTTTTTTTVAQRDQTSEDIRNWSLQVDNVNNTING